MTLKELRQQYIAEMTERITDPKEACSDKVGDTLEAFAKGEGRLPMRAFYREHLAYILQRDRVENRQELFDQAMAEWFEGEI